MSKLYLFSFTWSIGCNFVAPAEDQEYLYTPSASHYDLRQEHEEEHNQFTPVTQCNPFDAFIRGIFHNYPSLSGILPPAPHSVFDYFLNLDTEHFVLWQTLVPKADVLIQKTLTQGVAVTDSLTVIKDESATLDELKTKCLVPTRDTIRYGFLLALLLLNNHPVLLTGDVGVGKSILVEDVLLRLSKEVGKCQFTVFRARNSRLQMQMQIFCVYRPYKELISKEMNNDNDLNLHSMTKLSGWLRYCSYIHLHG